MINGSYPFPTFSGLINKEHRKRMGTAIWDFLWCVDRTTKEYIDKDGELRGQIYGGKPVKAEDIAEDLGAHPETVKKNLRSLHQEGYIELKRAPYGYIIEVRKSKKFLKNRKKPDDNKQSENTLSDEDRQSELTLTEGDRQNQNASSGQSENTLSQDRQSENTLSRESQNALSNKTCQLDIKDRKIDRLIDTPAYTEGDGVPSTDDKGHEISPSSPSKIGGVPLTDPPKVDEIPISDIEQVERYFIQKRNRGFIIHHKDTALIQELLQDGIPLQAIYDGIDYAFKHHEPRFKGDDIKRFSYCDTAIRQQYYQKQMRQQAMRGGESHAQTNRGYSGGNPAKNRSQTSGTRTKTKTAADEIRELRARKKI